MARFANLKNRTPAPRIKVEVVQTGHEIYGAQFAIYQDDRGRRAKLIPGMADEDGTILASSFKSGLFPLFRVGKSSPSTSSSGADEKAERDHEVKQ